MVLRCCRVCDKMKYVPEKSNIETSFDYVFRVELATLADELMFQIDDWLALNPQGLYSYSISQYGHCYLYIIYFVDDYDAIRFKMDFSRYAKLTKHDEYAIPMISNIRKDNDD
jgi:hypothetical protein